LNGDESNLGQQWMMNPHTIRIYRVVLYSKERERHA